MARRSRSNRVNIWPGFVDALTTLVMVVIFVLVVFIFAQQFLSTQLNDNVSQIKNLLNENEQLEFEKFELQEINTQLDNELNAVRQELASLRGERNILRDNLDDRRQEIQSLAGNVDTLREEEQSLLKRLAAAELQNRQLRAENTKLAADLALNQEVLAQAEQQRVALVQRVRDDGDLTEAMEETIVQADAQQMVNIDRFVELRDEFLASIQNIAPTIASEEERNLLLELAERIPPNPETDINNVDPDRASRLRTTVQSTQDLMEAMFQLAEQKQEELNILLGTLMDARERLSDAEQALLDDELLVAQLRQQNEQVSKELVDANEAISVNEFTIEAKLAEIQILTDVRDDLQDRVNDLQGSILAFENSINALRSTVGERERELSDTVVNYEERIQNLLFQLQAQEEQQAALQEALDARSKELAAREQQLEETLLQLARGESDLQTLVEERTINQTALQQALDRIAELDQLLITQTTQLSAARLEVTSSLERVDNKDIQINELAAKLAAAEGETTASRAQLRDARSQIDTLNAQLFDVRQKLSRIEAVLLERNATVRAQGLELENASLEMAAVLADQLALEQELTSALQQRDAILSQAQSSFAFAARDAAAGLDGIVVQEETSTVGEEELTQVRFKSREKIQFQLGSFEITEDSLIQLSLVAEDLVELTRRLPADLDWVIRIEGHTDQTPVAGNATGQFRNNIQLGFLRAEAVRNALLSTTTGLRADQLLASSFGETSPVQDASRLAGRAKTEADQLNRRIEFILAPR
ncbi:MAG: OmpA family protein [Alphaproteobacteria bacterium]